MFVYLAFTGARIEIPAAISAKSEGEETHFLDSRGVIIATFRTADVLLYSMQPIQTDPPSSSEFSGK